MPEKDNNNSMYSAGARGDSGEFSLARLFSSQKWVEHLEQLSKITNFEIHVFDEDGSNITGFKNNPICEFIKSAEAAGLDCPGSCCKYLQSREPVLFKCCARLIHFALPIERFGEKVVVVGRGGFAEYEDFLEFIKIAKENDLPGIPPSFSMEFPGEEIARSVSQYTHLSINRLLDSIEENERLEEKLLRMTSLFDSQTFEMLTKNPQLLYRYLLDTVEFVLGDVSSALMFYDEKGGVFRTGCSSGGKRETLADLFFDESSAVVKEMRTTKTVVNRDSLEQVVGTTLSGQVTFSYFFPVVIRGSLQVIIAVFDKQLSLQDIKAMNAFKDYVQLNLENHELRITVEKNRQTDEKSEYVTEFLGSIISVLDKKALSKTLLDKTLQLLNAEQGSLMILDGETSELVVEAYKSLSDAVTEKMRIKKGEGIAGIVLEHGGALLVKDIESDPRVRQENRPHYKTKSFISALINIENRLKGVLNVSDKLKGEAFNEADLNLLKSIIDNSVIAIERSFLYDQTEELRKLSITDHLTGIYNRRYLNRRLSEEITRYNRYKHPFSFMMLDLDRFKEYNDTFGHIAGDNLIKALAHITEKSLRAIDIAARFGGDEFVAIFPQTPKIDAIQITNRLKEQIDIALTEHNIDMPLTVSMGLATYPDDASSIMELIEKTDQALYLAKKGGGNRVVYL
jgi:diguanylate cyclase (GGDEF)-like protein